MPKIENLYDGDIRIDSLEKHLTDYIHLYVGDTNITYASVVGLLEIIKHKLIEQLED